MAYKQEKIKLLTGKNLIKRMAEEFLEERLGIPTTPKNIRRFAAHIIVFEREVEWQE